MNGFHLLAWIVIFVMACGCTTSASIRREKTHDLGQQELGVLLVWCLENRQRTRIFRIATC